MIFLKKSLAIICLIAFVISTTGISIKKHSCSIAGTTKVAIYPEIFGNSGSCCTMTTPPVSKNGQSVQNTPCCHNVFQYAKIAASYIYTFSGFHFIKLILDIPVDTIMQLSAIDTPQKSTFAEYESPPLSFFGTTLLHFIHNIKIALP